MLVNQRQEEGEVAELEVEEVSLVLEISQPCRGLLPVSNERANQGATLQAAEAGRLWLVPLSTPDSSTFAIVSPTFFSLDKGSINHPSSLSTPQRDAHMMRFTQIREHTENGHRS